MAKATQEYDRRHVFRSCFARGLWSCLPGCLQLSLEGCNGAVSLQDGRSQGLDLLLRVELVVDPHLHPSTTTRQTSDGSLSYEAGYGTQQLLLEIAGFCRGGGHATFWFCSRPPNILCVSA